MRTGEADKAEGDGVRLYVHIALPPYIGESGLY